MLQGWQGQRIRRPLCKLQSLATSVTGMPLAGSPLTPVALHAASFAALCGSPAHGMPPSLPGGVLLAIWDHASTYVKSGTHLLCTGVR